MRTSPTNNPGRKPGKRRVFLKYMREKLAIAVIVIVLALFALLYVLYDIVKNNKDSYNQIVLSQQNYESRTIPYRRGDIVDRNGTCLATTEKVYNLIIDPKQVMWDEANFLEATVSALVNVFGYDAQVIRSLITENASKQYIRYARQLSYEQKEAFEKLQEETNKANIANGSKTRVKGVWFEDEYRRYYPYNSLGCNVIGFVNSDGVDGSTGIERSYNEYLTGVNGREYGYLNDDSNLERVIKSAVNGGKVMSTIDIRIQTVVENHIQEWLNETGSDRVGVVVMDPNNGEVLAMASDKTFDLNDPRAVSGRYGEEEIREMGEKEAVSVYKNQHRNTDGSTITREQVPDHFSDEEVLSYGRQVAWNQEWRNFCISDTFEPGSPQKIFTVATAMEEGILDGSESFFCDGHQEVGGWDIACVKGTGHGNLTVAESLMQSCNDCMMQMAAMIGRNRFSKYQKMFGFGLKTGIDLPGEEDAASLVYSEENMDVTSLATNAFGQNYNCTMIQMAAAYCSVINGGSYYEPHVVRQVYNEQGSVVKKVDAKLVRETVSENTASFIQEALLRTVSEGTGKAAAVEGYEIAGKTGTAEKTPRDKKNYVVSFCGFAPAYNPQVLVYVVVDTPHVKDQPHSSYASGVFQKIMKEILPYLNIFPVVEQGPQEDGAGAFPENEGVTDNIAPLPPENPQPEETKAYETDEYIESGEEAGNGLPGMVPGQPPEESSTAGGDGNSGESAGTAESGAGGDEAESTGQETSGPEEGT